MIIVLLLLAVGCSPTSTTLSQARKGFTTHLTVTQKENDTAPQPPANLFRLVSYPSKIGNLAAYVGVDAFKGNGKKRPAIIWLIGGFSNGIGDTPWRPTSPDNDQSASAFRKAGIVMMYPSLRGGNTNPGHKEGFYGEVDDVVAALDYLSKQPGVDPSRIYLGGHSTGGTLALLTAEYTGRFRAVFSLGPVAFGANYGPESLPYDTTDTKEDDLRSPILWLSSVQSPTFVYEGTNQPGNIKSLEAMGRHNHNPLVFLQPVSNKNHFSAIYPTTTMLAQKVAQGIIPTADQMRAKRQESIGY